MVLIITVRMFRTQAPVKARTITMIGSCAWRNALEMNVQLKPGTTSLS